MRMFVSSSGVNTLQNSKSGKKKKVIFSRHSMTAHCDFHNSSTFYIIYFHPHTAKNNVFSHMAKIRPCWNLWNSVTHTISIYTYTLLSCLIITAHIAFLWMVQVHSCAHILAEVCTLCIWTPSLWHLCDALLCTQIPHKRRLWMWVRPYDSSTCPSVWNQVRHFNVSLIDISSVCPELDQTSSTGVVKKSTGVELWLIQ